MPDFAFSDLSGERRHLSDIAARLTEMMVWAPWCPPAVDELRHVEHAFQTLRPKGLAVLGLPESTDIESIRPLISTHQVTWPNATPQSVRELLGVGSASRRIPCSSSSIRSGALSRSTAAAGSECACGDRNSQRRYNGC